MKNILVFFWFLFRSVTKKTSEYQLPTSEYICLEDRLKTYKDNIKNNERGYVTKFMMCALLFFVPIVLINFGHGDINNKIHLFLVSSSFVLALYGSGFLYFESNHCDEALVRHVLNLTNGIPTKHSKRFFHWIAITGAYCAFVWLSMFLISGKNPVLFIFFLFFLISVAYYYFENSMHSWYKLQAYVQSLIQSRNEASDKKAINTFRNWYRKLGFKCLAWGAILGLLDIAKEAFEIKF
ncbi:hypothetical protein [Komagataeibacter europaeus]|uniref:hypothetical protein n=1 Tax=Komagataeibacter europaeus TaxID=33995 RepID=UPI0012DDCA0A|nr:hypothetical protein [Komagataeibacter europaeus]